MKVLIRRNGSEMRLGHDFRRFSVSIWVSRQQLLRRVWRPPCCPPAGSHWLSPGQSDRSSPRFLRSHGTRSSSWGKSHLGWLQKEINIKHNSLIFIVNIGAPSNVVHLSVGKFPRDKYSNSTKEILKVKYINVSGKYQNPFIDGGRTR